jgi:hypothetical protein
MVAIQNILLAAVTSSTLVSACCWCVTLKVRGKSLPSIPTLGQFIWQISLDPTATEQSAAGQISASTELEKYFPDCKAALEKLDKSQLPKYHATGTSATFINPPQACINDTTEVGTTKIENASFAVSGNNIVVSHAQPAFLQAFESLFGSEQASQAWATKPAAAITLMPNSWRHKAKRYYGYSTCSWLFAICLGVLCFVGVIGIEETKVKRTRGQSQSAEYLYLANETHANLSFPVTPESEMRIKGKKMF